MGGGVVEGLWGKVGCEVVFFLVVGREVFGGGGGGGKGVGGDVFQLFLFFFLPYFSLSSNCRCLLFHSRQRFPLQPNHDLSLSPPKCPPFSSPSSSSCPFPRGGREKRNERNGGRALLFIKSGGAERRGDNRGRKGGRGLGGEVFGPNFGGYLTVNFEVEM